MSQAARHISDSEAKRMILDAQIGSGQDWRNMRIRLSAIPPEHRDAFMNGMAVDIAGQWVRRVQP